MCVWGTYRFLLFVWIELVDSSLFKFNFNTGPKSFLVLMWEYLMWDAQNWSSRMSCFRSRSLFILLPIRFLFGVYFNSIISRKLTIREFQLWYRLAASENLFLLQNRISIGKTNKNGISQVKFIKFLLGASSPPFSSWGSRLTMKSLGDDY